MNENEQYKAALERLVKLYEMNTGASKSAAKLILSLCNEYWSFNTLELIRFDRANLKAALTAIEGRVVTMEHPSRFIPTKIIDEMVSRFVD